MTTPVAHTICPLEASRKLSQLHPVLLANETRDRVIQIDASSDLAGFLVQGRFDESRLIPLLVTVINYLNRRVADLENRPQCVLPH